MNNKINRLSQINSLSFRDYKVFSFDIFDTLISRVFPPEYIKILTSQYLKYKYPEHLSHHTCLDIYNIRRQIESSLEEDRVRQGYDRDYSFNECIALLVEKLFNNSGITSDIISFETSLEIAVASLNTDALPLLEALKEKGKRIICISDMYLGSEIISKILDAKGLLKYIDAVYVSSDLKLRKSTGNIFPQIIIKEGIQPSEMIHIGDNKQTDFIIPAQYGINTVYLSSPDEHKRYEKIDSILKDGPAYSNSLESLFEALSADFEFHGSKMISRIAETLSYPFIYYIYSLIDYCKARNIKKIYFLSREGLFLQKLFNVLNNSIGGDIQTEYLCVSRKSLFILSIPELSPEYINTILNCYEDYLFYFKAISISQILTMLMINNEETHRICYYYNIHPNQLLSTENLKDLITMVLSDNNIKNIYAKTFHEYTETFLKYLKFLGMPQEGSVLFADIGWSGSMQTYLQKFLSQNNYKTEIYGYYLGFDETLDRKKHKGNNFGKKSGLFHYGNNPDLSDVREKSIINNITLELIATASHGTVISYRDITHKVEPIYDADNDEEQRQFNQFSRPIQEHILQFANKYKSLLNILNKIFSKDQLYKYVLKECYNFFSNPDIRTSKTASKLYFVDNFFGYKQIWRFRDQCWWPNALMILNENRNIHGKLLSIMQKWMNKYYSLFWGVLNIGSRLIRSLWIYLYHKSKLSKISRILFYGRIYGLTVFLKVNIQRVIKRFHIHDRKLNLIRTYYFKKDRGEYQKVVYRYIFFTSFNPRYEEKTNALVRNLQSQKLEQVFAVISYRGNYTLITIEEIYKIKYEDITFEKAVELLSDHNFIITINDKVLLDDSFIRKIDKRLSADIADALYCDNDTIYKDIYYTNPKFKPCWSEFAFLEYDYIGPVIVVNVRQIIEDIDRFIKSYEKWSSRGGIISILENLKSIEHVPEVLYHDHQYDPESSCEPVNEYFRRNGIHANAVQNSKYTSLVTFPLKEEKQISIIIPFKDKVDFLRRSVSSIIKKTKYLSYEILLVNNNSTEEITHSYLDGLRGDKRIRIIDYNFVFNFSALNNHAVNQCNGEYVVFLNNDTEILTCDWLNRMLDYAHLPRVGCVGVKLLYPDGRIQHAGEVFNFNFQYPATNQFSFESKYSSGYLNRLVTVQNYSSVSAACMMMRKELFCDIGGFDESFVVAYNDLDLCCRLKNKGFEVICNPHVEVIHYEYVSRGNPADSKTDMDERDMFIEKWKDMFKDGDPHHSPYLDLFGNIIK